MARFASVSCSQCGRTFGPGDSGFSHCDQHRTKHTPGPWILDLPDPGEHPFARYATVRADRWGYIAQTGIDTSLPHWDGPQRANARLIAAAPDLLEALQAMTPLFTINADSDYEVFHRARAAIAKATGAD